MIDGQQVSLPLKTHGRIPVFNKLPRRRANEVLLFQIGKFQIPKKQVQTESRRILLIENTKAISLLLHKLQNLVILQQNNQPSQQTICSVKSLQYVCTVIKTELIFSFSYSVLDKRVRSSLIGLFLVN